MGKDYNRKNKYDFDDDEFFHENERHTKLDKKLLRKDAKKQEEFLTRLTNDEDYFSKKNNKNK